MQCKRLGLVAFAVEEQDRNGWCMGSYMHDDEFGDGFHGGLRPKEAEKVTNGPVAENRCTLEEWQCFGMWCTFFSLPRMLWMTSERAAMERGAQSVVRCHENLPAFLRGSIILAENISEGYQYSWWSRGVYSG
ncbi:hypothetical protein NCU02843 [Neurospora crassa OR74A]|uniref:Uncharacterized protein n=1 Tax=Neurospora crassa (strain ATCC 24698 / 74-OR23-1A / CBS 708.71 / DSM 1257 / FGSC 987) TaxID=367110 RepID=V5IRH5_NEUCR|nr:hypothetical protein NCU02843 [Neurospora crassa OR74A]ESA44374.1 hypothetical protein NCU02843 [Neurospora crassa OR74A]|eukprot:XP_011393041.1 hypothetical protein NCU02843 [Neurospora crassa OR74A]